VKLDRCLFNSSQDKTETYITGGFLLTKIFLPGAEQADVYATVGAPVLEKMLSGQDQLLLVYGQKEAMHGCSKRNIWVWMRCWGS
jgi:hypothetical protein